MVLEPVRALAAGVLAVLVGLFAWSVLPLLAGYDANVVLSGSMAPAISPGDVVLTLPVDAEDVRPGRVVRFADPDFPGRTRLHRVSTVADDGTVVTRGDANALEDSTPMTASDVTGLARIRVPYIGLLVMWRDTGEHRRLALGLVGLLALTVLATLRTGAPQQSPPLAPHHAPPLARRRRDPAVPGSAPAGTDHREQGTQ